MKLIGNIPKTIPGPAPGPDAALISPSGAPKRCWSGV